MKFIYLIVFFIYISSLFIYTDGFCLGMFCSYMPFMAKSCCSVVKKCCGHYQAWLSPLMTIDDNPDDYLGALTHEYVHDNLGSSGFFESDVHRYPGVFNNINRFYKRHNRRSDEDNNNLITNQGDKLNKLENLQLNSLTSFQESKPNKNLR